VGLAASRFLKASSSQRYRTSLAAEPMPSGAATTGARFERQEHGNGEHGGFRPEGSMVSTEPRA